MKIDGRITFLFSERGADIEITDRTSGQTFFRAEMTPVQVSQMLGRLAHCEMKSAEVIGLDRVGKIRETKTVSFELPEGVSKYSDVDRPIIKAAAIAACPEGWTPRLYFDSRDSFFIRGVKSYCRITINRWVDRQEADGAEHVG